MMSDDEIVAVMAHELAHVQSQHVLYKIAARLFSFAAGQSLTEHATPARALVQILSGSCEFVLAGKASVLKAGDFVHMPPGALHAVRATEAFTMLLTLLRSSPYA